MPYTIHDHKHDFAAWASARATGRALAGFTNPKAKEIIEGIGLDRIITSPLNLPEPINMDAQHEEWREAAIHEAGLRRIAFTHGRAAKLINVYLKSTFVCGGEHDHPRVRAVHPPIDEILLKCLAKENAGGLGADWRRWRRRGWTSFNSTTYQDVIDAVKRALPNRPLWEIEEFWR